VSSNTVRQPSSMWNRLTTCSFLVEELEMRLVHLLVARDLVVLLSPSQALPSLCVTQASSSSLEAAFTSA